MKSSSLVALFALSACAPSAAMDEGAASRIAKDAAISVRELAEANARYSPENPEVVRLTAAQTSLMESGDSLGQAFKSELDEALKYQLADMRRDFSEMEIRYSEGHPERAKAQAAISALEDALMLRTKD